MATNKPKFYWHIHHEILLEETSNIQKRIAYINVLKDYYKAQEAYIKAWEIYYNVLKDYYKAQEAYNKAREACNTEIEKLHREEHPDCPWNGKTIFSEVE